MTTSFVLSLLVIPMTFEIYDTFIKNFNIKYKKIKNQFHGILKEAQQQNFQIRICSIQLFYGKYWFILDDLE